MRSVLSTLRQWRRMWRTVCVYVSYRYTGVIPGTWIAASYALRPITLVRIRNKAVASAFERPTYSLRVSCDYSVCQIVALWPPRVRCVWLIHFCYQKSIPYLRIRVASLITCVSPLMRLRLCCGPHLSLSAYIHSFIKLALLTTCAVAISRPIYGLSCVSLALRIQTYILSAI
jgi:hypothetical protein